MIPHSRLVAVVAVLVAFGVGPQASLLTAIAPGIFKTPMLEGLGEDIQNSLAATVTCPRRLGDPREYANLAKFIVECGYLNGETIRIDGALRMQ